jgi:aspartyl-tRNA(Asn)/glutamyl-tRNA(Gln) amidotransferase subunit C
MSLSAEEIRRIARLARLALDDGEIDRYGRELGRILAFVDALRAAPLEESPAELLGPWARPTPLREDRVEEEGRPDLCQAGAPESRDGYYLVPRVIEP